MTSPTSAPDLETIRENSYHREESTSPEPTTSPIDTYDFEPRVPDRRSTHPPLSLSSPLKSSTGDIGASTPFQRASARPTSHRGRAHFHVPKSLTFRSWKSKFRDGEASPAGLRRRSTINTQTSASFEETEVWDHKAILSLGMNPCITHGAPHRSGG